MAIADDVTRVPITSQMRPIALGKMFAPTDADFPAEVKAAVDLVRNMPAIAAAAEAEGKKDPDSDYAVFRSRNGQVYAAISRKGIACINDHSFDVEEMSRAVNHLSGMTRTKALTEWMAKKLGPDYTVSYPTDGSSTIEGRPGTKAASSTQSRTSLQRQMDLLAINQKACPTPRSPGVKPWYLQTEYQA